MTKILVSGSIMLSNQCRFRLLTSRLNWKYPIDFQNSKIEYSVYRVIKTTTTKQWNICDVAFYISAHEQMSTIFLWCFTQFQSIRAPVIQLLKCWLPIFDLRLRQKFSNSKRVSIAHSLSLSYHHPDMTEISLKRTKYRKWYIYPNSQFFLIQNLFLLS